VDAQPDARRLQEAWAANVPGSTKDHVVVVLPSFSLSETLAAHYATRLPALEHRFLLASLMLHRIEGCEMVFLACAHPGDDVLDYYLSLAPEPLRDSVRSRLRVIVVDDPTGRGLAEKLLDRPDLVSEVRSAVRGRPAYLEPWNVTAHEVELSRMLGVPILGTPPDLWPLGFKSAGRRLFARAGVPAPFGCEDVRDRAGVEAAMTRIRAEHPGAAGVVVKHDDSGAGDGNLVVRFGAVERGALDAIPAWYLDDLAHGGVVEVLMTGEEFASPSVQVDITPNGEVRVVSTHEQVLGGDSGQVYVGCRFPARRAYAPRIADHAVAVGKVLRDEGALGRFTVDFAAVRSGGDWEVRALEINLRRGGTTHPFCVLRHLVPGRYDAATGEWCSDEGERREYVATDNLVEPAWAGLTPAAVIDAVRGAGIGWDAATRTGVILHMLSGLGIDGRIGFTAIGRDAAETDHLHAATGATIGALVR
jgi:hypothetical protein